MIESQRHSYHLVDPSPWPISGSLGALATTVGGVMYMHPFQGGATLLSLGLIFLLYTMFVWWRDVLRESTLEGHHTKVVQLGPRYGFILFIVSEVMFLFALFRASFHSSLAPSALTIFLGKVRLMKNLSVVIVFFLTICFCRNQKMKKILFHIENSLFFFYNRHPYLKFFIRKIFLLFLFLYFAHLSYFVYKNTQTLLMCSLLPHDIELLRMYLSRPEQDPEWVQFVWERLQNSPPAEFESQFRSFMDIEMCSSTKEQIITLYKLIFFGREDPLIHIPESFLDYTLRRFLDNTGNSLNQTYLSDTLISLCQERNNSPFYRDILQTDDFQSFWEKEGERQIQKNKSKALLEEYNLLSTYCTNLKEENLRLASLKFK